MKTQFFACSFSVFILILLIISAKHHTLHGMPRFHINSTQDGDFVTKDIYSDVCRFFSNMASFQFVANNL